MLRTIASAHLALVGTILAIGACGPTPELPAEAFPGRVLLTNDNGIDDTALIELARAFARVPGIEVIVVAATRDRSGTSNYMGATITSQYRVERRELGQNIEAWALDGYPADCVLFALSGPLRDRLPDVVVSGINGGPNLGDDWFGSGTIGAARAAAYFGIPAVAVSGVEDDDPAAVAAATEWVVRFVRSSIVASLEAPQYLTVSLPFGTPPEVGEARIVERARGLMGGRSTRVEGDDSVSIWQLEIEAQYERAPAGTDVSTVAAGDIAIVPMRANEYDAELAGLLRSRAGAIPEWIVPDAPARGPGFVCDVGLGIVFDDAEDETGFEWGVVLEEVAPTGLANEVGLEVGDVIISLNGMALESERSDPEDPDDRFLRLLRDLPCGSDVAMEYVRDGRRDTARFTWEPDPGD
jgi:5'-nucleotidase